jgi:hypothetical protein
MRQKFLIFTALIFLIIVLIGLNAASYVQKEKTPDSETNPNRSTYNAGATGTRAFYDLLAETGRRVTRWQEPPSALAGSKNKLQTFVVIGATRREFTERETVELLEWVSQGGRLVVIDREPPKELIKTTANWSVSAVTAKAATFFDIDPSNQKQMTEKIAAAAPLQPTVYTNRVNAVQPSRFASSIIFERFSDDFKSKNKVPVISSGTGTQESNKNYYKQQAPPPKAAPSKNGTGEGSGSGMGKSPSTAETYEEVEEYESPTLAAPVAHLANNDKTLLVDFPFDSGQIIFLTDPYIVSNGGINLVDNAQLAINLVTTAGDGLIAFDEFHQGYGRNDNRLLGYFAGTPLTAILLQFATLAGLILFSQSRRFARPLPEDEPNRLSKLEYVAAMAELQQRTRAYDLAIENIYTDFRRRVSRLVGADNFTVSLRELSQLISERAGLNAAELERLMFKCEEIIRGERTNKREVLDLTSRLRTIEEKLGLKRHKGARK